MPLFHLRLVYKLCWTTLKQSLRRNLLFSSGVAGYPTFRQLTISLYCGQLQLSDSWSSALGDMGHSLPNLVEFHPIQKCRDLIQILGESFPHSFFVSRILMCNFQPSSSQYFHLLFSAEKLLSSTGFLLSVVWNLTSGRKQGQLQDLVYFYFFRIIV